MSKRPPDCQVMIAGGGPAGAALALRLARLGCDVWLAEGQAFPRRHIGVSLAPAAMPVLDQIGVRDRLEAMPCYRPASTIVHWAGRTDILEHPPGQAGALVNRGRFDQILLDEARRAGVRLLQPARVVAARRGRSHVWEVEIESEGRSRAVTTRFLAIAAGRRSALWGRRKRVSAPVLALHGFCKAARGVTPQVRVEAAESCWYWAAPLADGTVAAAVFLDPQQLRRFSSVPDAFSQLLGASRLIGPCIAGAPEAVEACSASRDIIEPGADRDFIRVGDAAFTVDPLSAQGVLHAIVSGLQGAAVVNTILRRPQDGDAALSFFRARQQEAVARDREIGGRHYRAQAAFASNAFWTGLTGEHADAQGFRRSDPPPADVPLHLSERASLRSEPVITGDYVSLAPALAHPGLDRPIAFVRNVPIAELTASLRGGAVLPVLMEQWAGRLPEREARNLLATLWSRNVIEAAMRR
jgi:flavin-dependent dehydrogenase